MVEFSELVTRFEKGEIKVGVLGLGYVGLPLCVACISGGLKVVGFDIDAAKVDILNKGRSVIRSVKDDLVAQMVASGRFVATSDSKAFKEVDAILVCVPTPLGHHREPDLTFVEKASETIAEVMRPGQLVVLESSTFPGTTDEIVRPILEGRDNLKAGKDFYLAYSPEREDPGNPIYTTSNTPRVVGADDPQSAKLAVSLYSHIVHHVHLVASTRVAEAVKITENAFRCVNIAFINELKLIYSRMGINIWDVIEAAKTKPFGFMAFYPGPGLGGHCIPIDPFYLTWKAKEFDMATRFVETAGEVNSAMPYCVVDLMADGMGRARKMSMAGANILIVGIAYKKNLDDLRESPALKVWEILEERGARVAFYDPFIPVVPSTREYKALAGRETIKWTKEAVSKYDAALITTDHDDVDYAQLVEWSPLVFDSRNATKALPAALKQRVILV